MKLCFKILATVVFAATTYSLIGCAAPSSFSYQNVTVAIAAQCSDCQSGQVVVSYNPAYPVPSVPNGPAPAGSVILMPNAGQGGVITLQAFVTNAPPNVTWTIYPTPNLGQPSPPSGTGTPVGESGSSVGTISAASGTTAYYAQNGVPVYSGAALAQAQALGIPQGDVLIVASVPNDPNNPASVATGSQLIQIFNSQPGVYLTPVTPSSPAGLTNPVATITHNGGTFQFFGGVVGTAPCAGTSPPPTGCGTSPQGTTDNTAVWYVGPAPCAKTPTTAIAGGSSTYGFISSTGLYTAPATIPVTQPAVYVGAHFTTQGGTAPATVATCANIAIN